MCQKYIASNIERSSFTAVVGIKISSPNPEIYCCKRSTHKFSSFLFNDTNKEKLCFMQFSTRMAGWLLLAFLIFLHNQLSSTIMEKI